MAEWKREEMLPAVKTSVPICQFATSGQQWAIQASSASTPRQSAQQKNKVLHRQFSSPTLEIERENEQQT
ncbi:hypothetical protein [Phyllobacterium myrsinacearum]|uniref:Uncharacterized protein n=1 Tax=Phyllobacterium myrsinacearum TaxID=28101 RepID=A0A839EPZ9_9HYPH|nr:hypothetical protein [Phyllobacterium myrsinacearum]MBA8880892.1 hypothetical protein [Phyllobacterium myrsinacearum]